MKLNTLKAAAIFSLSVPLIANAGMLGDLNQMFISNSTSAQTMRSKDRVGMMGGSLYLRAPVKSITIVAYDLPRMNAGCGGVDLFGGSFSFIDSQQLVQIFRQVAANAAGLAFKAAIKTISPNLDALISEFQTLMQNMNNLAKNSCSMAHVIVDKAEREIHNALDGDGSVAATKKGMFTDAIGGLTGYLADANNYLKKQGEVNPNAGNGTMKAILASGAANILGLAGLSNFDNSNDDASDPNSLNNKLLVSALGYQVAGVPCTTVNENGTPDKAPMGNGNLPKIQCKGPATITLDDLIQGGGTGSIRSTTPLTLYGCVDPAGSGTPNGGTDPQICSQMKKEKFNYYGIQGWVNTMLFGSATVEPVSDTSIVGKFNAGAGLKFTSDQLLFIKNSGMPVIPLLSKTSNQAVRISIAHRLGVHLTDCLGARFGEAMYKAANGVQYGHHFELSEDSKSNIQQLRTDYLALQSTCLHDKTTLTIAQELLAVTNLNGNVK